MALNGVEELCYLPRTLNINAKKFNQYRINSGSNYNFLNIVTLLIISLRVYTLIHVIAENWNEIKAVKVVDLISTNDY